MPSGSPSGSASAVGVGLECDGSLVPSGSPSGVAVVFFGRVVGSLSGSPVGAAAVVFGLSPPGSLSGVGLGSPSGSPSGSGEELSSCREYFTQDLPLPDT